MRADDHALTPPPSADHLSDDELMAICFAAADDGHLRRCEACRSRYDGLVRSLDQIRADAVREADAMFTTERLAAQRDRILRRIEHVRHAAEVVTLPGQSAGEQRERRTPVRAKRWIAMAAAAGLVAGLLLGHFVNIGSRPVSSTRSPLAPVGAPAVMAEPVMMAAGPADDEFLVLIEDAVISRRAAELRTLDALTSPELREISIELP